MMDSSHRCFRRRQQQDFISFTERGNVPRRARDNVIYTETFILHLRKPLDEASHGDSRAHKILMFTIR